jgi:hypothetical protein
MATTTMMIMMIMTMTMTMVAMVIPIVSPQFITGCYIVMSRRVLLDSYPWIQASRQILAPIKCK